MSRTPLRQRSAYRKWYPITTRWLDNDIYGHVNNVVYYSWFDTAVCTFLLNAAALEACEEPLMGFVVDSACRYAESLAFPTEVEVGLVVAKLGTSSVTYHLGIFAKGAENASAEGHFTHVYVDRESRRPMPLQPYWRVTFERVT